MSLSFDTRTIAAEAVVVEAELPRDHGVWLPEDTRPIDAVQVTGRLSMAGEGRFYFAGHLTGTVAGDCRRCLTPVTVAVADELVALLTDASNEEADDPDVFPLADGGARVDLGPAVREQWILTAPAFALCRPDCQGLCVHCGADLNVGACSCAPAPDPRWDALRQAAD
jgi:uncharacterized protein